MLKKSFKNLSIGLLIMAIGSTVVDASEGSHVDDDIGITPAIDPRKVLLTLKRTLTPQAVDFSGELLTKRAKTVEDLLREYKGAKNHNQEKILTAVIMGAVENLTSRGSDKIWVTARLASFLLGNRLLPPTYGWLDDDVEILTYLRDPETQSVTDTSSLIYQLTQKFIKGAENFTETYSLYDQFTLTQYSFDTSGIFGGIGQRFLPSAVDIFNEAVISNWGDAIVIQREGSAESRANDDTSSITASTTSTAYSSAFSLQSQNGVILSAETSPANFSTALYDYPVSKEKGDAKQSMKNALDLYKNQQSSRQQMLAFAFKGILDCLTTNRADLSRLAHWKVARLAYFLLANRLLPPNHEWLGVVSSTSETQEENNNTRLKYLMGENGMLQSAMDRLLKLQLDEPEPITESTGSLTCIRSLATSFKRGAEGYMEARAGFRDLAKKQRDLDTSGIFGDTRHMPSALTIFGASMNSKKTMYQFPNSTNTHIENKYDQPSSEKPTSNYSSHLYWAIPVGVAVVGATCWLLKDNNSVKQAIESFRASFTGKKE